MKKYLHLSLQTEEKENSYWLSISDLMTGLLMIIILALSYYIINFSEKTQELVGTNIKRIDLLRLIQKKMKDKGIEVIIDYEHGILRLPEGILFDSGKAEIKEAGMKVLQKLGPVLYEVLISPEFNGTVETIFIEGHTDDIPINNLRYPSNWELSTQRAINTWRALRKITPELRLLKNKNDEPIFSCSGYGPTRPILPNNCSENRRKNRRIDFRFSMVSPSLEEKPLIKRIKERMQSLKVNE